MPSVQMLDSCQSLHEASAFVKNVKVRPAKSRSGRPGSKDSVVSSGSASTAGAAGSASEAGVCASVLVSPPSLHAVNAEAARSAQRSRLMVFFILERIHLFPG